MIADNNYRLDSLTDQGRVLADHLSALLRVWPNRLIPLWVSGPHYHDGMLAQERITQYVDAHHAVRRLLYALTQYSEDDVCKNHDLQFSRVDAPAAVEEVQS